MTGLRWKSSWSRDSTLVAFSTFAAFQASLEAKKQNIWSTAVRRGLESRAQESPQTESSVAVWLRSPVGTHQVDKIVQCDDGSRSLTKLLGMEVLISSTLSLAPAGISSSVSIGLLLVDSEMISVAIHAVEQQQGLFEPGFTFVVVDLPSDDVMSVCVDDYQYVAYGFEKDKDGKDVLSLRRWEALQETIPKVVPRTGELQGFGVPSGGALIFYPDGWVEALLSPAVRLRPRAEVKDAEKPWVVLDNDENAFNLPRGFDRGVSPFTVVADWVVAGSCLAFTGAGISKESGVPTFRDGDGLWERYDAMEVSSIGGFAGEPAKVWDFEREFNAILDRCKGPNPGHVALAVLEKLKCVDLVVTQNVDGFQQLAGSKNVLELHGSEVHAVCLNKGCGRRIEMRDIFREQIGDQRAEMKIWSPLARGWGVRWPERSDDTDLQKAVREQLTELQRPQKRRRLSACTPTKKVGAVKRREKAHEASCACSPEVSTAATSTGGSAAVGSGCSSSSESSVSATTSSSEGSSSGTSGKVGFAKRAISRACSANALSSELLERGPPECRVPICPTCSTGILKPDGIFFGEPLEPKVLKRSVRQSAKSKVVLMVGTSGTVDPAAKLPLVAKQKNGAKIVEVNTKETRLSSIADIRLWGPSAVILPKVEHLVSTHYQKDGFRRLHDTQER